MSKGAARGPRPRPQGRTAGTGKTPPAEGERKCRECGCTEATACRLPDRNCAWVQGEDDLCDNPKCLRAAAQTLWDAFHAGDDPNERDALYERLCALTCHPNYGRQEA